MRPDRIMRGLSSIGARGAGLDWPGSLLVPFEARKLKRASVVWLHRKWFVDQGIDIVDAAVRRQVEAWLIDEFGYVVASGLEMGQARLFYADRYGGSGLAPHGGSGRAGIFGGFQVKGIGPTPLIGDVREWSYSHGCCWMEEALREAVFSLIAGDEFPHGASPVIAVLDTGFNHAHENGDIGERRALLIRPAPLRPAHLQRAPMFKPADESMLHHLDDVARVRAAWMHVDEAAEEGIFDVGNLFDRITEQIAFGQVHRLFHGGYYTSNITMDGSLLDFGSFRAVPDWSTPLASGRSNAVAGEFQAFAEAIRSLAFYSSKYQPRGQREWRDERMLLRRAEASYKKALSREFAAVWGFNDASPLSREIAAITEEYFMQQRRLRLDYAQPLRPDHGWLYEFLKDAETHAATSAEHRTWNAIRDAVSRHEGSRAPATLTRIHLTGRRHLKPRYILEREALQSRIYSAIGGLGGTTEPDPKVIHKVVCNVLSAGRRIWRVLPPYLGVCAQSADDLSAALYCVDYRSGRRRVWLQGSVVGGTLYVFGNKVAIAQLAEHEVYRQGADWAGLFDGSLDEKSHWHIQHDVLAPMYIPPVSVYYSGTPTALCAGADSHVH